LQRKLKKIGFEENEGFVMIKVLIFSDSLTIYIVSGCQLLTFFEEKNKNCNIKLQAVVSFLIITVILPLFTGKPFQL